MSTAKAMLNGVKLCCFLCFSEKQAVNVQRPSQTMQPHNNKTAHSKNSQASPCRHQQLVYKYRGDIDKNRNKELTYSCQAMVSSLAFELGQPELPNPEESSTS